MSRVTSVTGLEVVVEEKGRNRRNRPLLIKQHSKLFPGFARGLSEEYVVMKQEQESAKRLQCYLR